MSEEIRPVVDFSKLSWGSLKRYEALYGIQTNDEDLRECVREHFALTCYNILKSPHEDVKPLAPQTNQTSDAKAFKTDHRTPQEVIDTFLKIKVDERDELTGLRKTIRTRQTADKSLL